MDNFNLAKIEQYPKTKNGYAMDMILRSKIIRVMTDLDNEGISKKEIADKCNISYDSLNNYLTKETWKEIRQKRLQVVLKYISDNIKDINVEDAKHIYNVFDRLRGE